MWGLLAFLLFILVAAGPGAFARLDVVFNWRTANVLQMAMVVAVVWLAGVFRSVRWPDPDGRARRIWNACGILALLPLALFVVQGVTVQPHKIAAESATATDAVKLSLNAVMSALGLGAPTVAVWLAIGLRLKAPAQYGVRAAAGGLLMLLRQLGPLCVIISGYAWMELVIGEPKQTADAALAAADAALFGGRDPIELLEPLISAPLSEWMAFSYSFYAFLFPLAVGTVFYRLGERGLEEVSTAVGFALLVAYVSYLLMPAVGPMFVKKYTVPLELYWIRDVKEALMDRLRIPWDCFPSMHTCITLLLSFACWRHARGLFWATLPMVVTIPVACVYLRYHYVVDVLAGAVLFVAIAAVTRWRYPLAPLEQAQATALPSDG